MDFLNTLSDDQIAILGCVAALLVCGGVMSLSFYVGRILRPSRSDAQDVPSIPIGPAAGRRIDPAQPTTRRRRAA